MLRGKQIALFCSHFKWVRASVELDNSLQPTRCKHLVNFIISTTIFLFISSMSSAALITWLVMVSHFESLFWMKYGPAQSSPPKQSPLQTHIKGFGKAMCEMLFWLLKLIQERKYTYGGACRTLLLDGKEHNPLSLTLNSTSSGWPLLTLTVPFPVHTFDNVLCSYSVSSFSITN